MISPLRHHTKGGVSLTSNAAKHHQPFPLSYILSPYTHPKPTRKRSTPLDPSKSSHYTPNYHTAVTKPQPLHHYTRCRSSFPHLVTCPTMASTPPSDFRHHKWRSNASAPSTIVTSKTKPIFCRHGALHERLHYHFLSQNRHTPHMPLPTSSTTLVAVSLSPLPPDPSPTGVAALVSLPCVIFPVDTAYVPKIILF